MSQLKERLLPLLPLDRRKIAERITAGCNRQIIDYLLSRFCVSEDTDLNDDLGFKFCLWPKTHIAANQVFNGKHVLYISCVIPCVAIRFYAGNPQAGFRSDSVAMSKKAIEDNRRLNMLCNFLGECGYTVLTEEDLSQKIDDELLKLSDDSCEGYFNLLFSEYQ